MMQMYKKLEKRKNASVAEVDLKTAEQSIDEFEKKTIESTPIPNAEEQEAKAVEFSRVANGN